MSSSNRGIVLVIGGAVVLAVGVALFFLLYWQPREANKEMQREVDAWGAEWEKARTCLVGATPLAADGYTAMAMRELTEPKLRSLLRQCTDNLKAIKRSEGYDSGGKVEDAWNDLKEGRKKLAKAHAWRSAVKPLRGIDADDVRNQLAQAISIIDEGYDELRIAAGLKPQPREGKSLPVLVDAAAVTTPDGGDLDIEELEVTGDLIGVLGAKAGEKQGSLLVELTATRKSFVVAGEWVAMAADDTPWGAWLVSDGKRRSPRQASMVLESASVDVMAGPVGKDGEPVAGKEVRVYTIPKAKRPAWATDGSRKFGPEVGLFATGAGSLRVVGLSLYAVDAEDWVGVFRSTDSGASFGRADVIAGGSGLGVRFNQRRLVIGSRDAPAREIAPTRGSLDAHPHANRSCHSATVTWVVKEGGVSLRGKDGVSEVAHNGDGRSDRRACSDKQLISAASDSDGSQPIVRTLVCDDNACKADKVPHLGETYRISVGDKGGAVVAQRLGDIILAWQWKDGGWKPAAGARAPAAWKLSGIVEWDGAHQAVFRDGNRLRIGGLGAL